MAHSFYSHITKFTKLEEVEFEAVLPFFKTIKASKKENLLTAGQLCKTHFFVLEGCLRKFSSPTQHWPALVACACTFAQV